MSFIRACLVTAPPFDHGKAQNWVISYNGKQSETDAPRPAVVIDPRVIVFREFCWPAL